MLSDVEIQEAMSQGKIVIDPFTEGHLGPNGYDVTLGPYSWVMKDNPDKGTFDCAIDLRSKKIHYEGQQTIRRDSISSLYELDDASRHDGSVFFPPHTMMLCHTQEVVGTPWQEDDKNIVAIFETRSTLARLGMPFHFAGMGDVGFSSKWTLEICNFTDYPIILPVGYRVGQFIFDRVGKVAKPYVGRYSSQDWKPEDMLPRL